MYNIYGYYQDIEDKNSINCVMNNNIITCNVSGNIISSNISGNTINVTPTLAPVITPTQGPVITPPQIIIKETPFETPYMISKEESPTIMPDETLNESTTIIPDESTQDNSSVNFYSIINQLINSPIKVKLALGDEKKINII
jgi:hypothetical protein